MSGSRALRVPKFRMVHLCVLFLLLLAKFSRFGIKTATGGGI